MNWAFEGRDPSLGRLFRSGIYGSAGGGLVAFVEGDG